MHTALGKATRSAALIASLLGLALFGGIAPAGAQTVVLDCHYSMDPKTRIDVTLTIDYGQQQVTFLYHPSASSTAPISVTETQVTWTLRNISYALNRYTGELIEYNPTGVPRDWHKQCEPGGRRF